MGGAEKAAASRRFLRAGALPACLSRHPSLRHVVFSIAAISSLHATVCFMRLSRMLNVLRFICRRLACGYLLSKTLGDAPIVVTAGWQKPALVTPHQSRAESLATGPTGDAPSSSVCSRRISCACRGTTAARGPRRRAPAASTARARPRVRRGKRGRRRLRRAESARRSRGGAAAMATVEDNAPPRPTACALSGQYTPPSARFDRCSLSRRRRGRPHCRPRPRPMHARTSGAPLTLMTLA